MLIPRSDAMTLVDECLADFIEVVVLTTKGGQSLPDPKEFIERWTQEQGTGWSAESKRRVIGLCALYLEVHEALLEHPEAMN